MCGALATPATRALVSRREQGTACAPHAAGAVGPTSALQRATGHAIHVQKRVVHCAVYTVVLNAHYGGPLLRLRHIDY